jgi:hypothetical protein
MESSIVIVGEEAAPEAICQRAGPAHYGRLPSVSAVTGHGTGRIGDGHDIDDVEAHAAQQV